MARLRAKHLPHRVTVTRLLGEGSDGSTYDTPVTETPAYVEQKARLVVDRRAASPTLGQEITASTTAWLLTDDDVLPASKVTVWPGTTRERESEVIDSALFDYPRTPNHVQVFLT